MVNHKIRVLVPLAVVLLLTDCTTKRLAEQHLLPGIPERFVGDIVRFTLGYNEGVAFGITVAPAAYSRLGVILLAALALAVVLWMYVRAPASPTRHLVALALIAGGALGNLLDRFVSPGGVVDFIDIGFRGYRFWTFNVADVGITMGATLLVWELMRGDPSQHHRHTDDSLA